MKEIEVRFLEIDKELLIEKLESLGAEDFGEQMLEETIIYDPEATWRKDNKFVRLRKNGSTIKLSYKEHMAHTVDGAYEIEFEISDYKKAEIFLEKIGLKSFRQQQKKRHTFHLDGVSIDIDTWPRIPTYVEFEAESEKLLKDFVAKIGYDWDKAVFHNAAWIIENKYTIPVTQLRWFTFDRYE